MGQDDEGAGAPIFVPVEAKTHPPEDVEMADSLPPDLIQSVCLVEDRARSDCLRYSPTELTDARVMSKRVGDCLDLLKVAYMTVRLVDYVPNL